MTYNSKSHIESVKDVEAFFHHIVFERKVNFHPDDAFDQYICIETHESSFTPDECILYNRLMDESFNVCENEGVDIYEIGLNICKIVNKCIMTGLLWASYGRFNSVSSEQPPKSDIRPTNTEFVGIFLAIACFSDAFCLTLYPINGI